MSGHRFDYTSERQRHEKFVGRAGLLAQLDQLLVDSATDCWAVITGGPGMGKSALLAAWLARREAAGAAVPHHFIRRGAYDWDDPAKLVGSLVAQIEDGLPDLREPDGDERMHPATRLARALSRVSENVLRPRGERLVVLIDGLDEYDAPVGSSAGDPLAAFLPDALPAGVRLLCASRPRHPYISSLDARDGELVQIDLDGPENAATNDATVRAFWETAAAPLGLDAGFVAEAVARAGGNVQHAVQLRKRLAVLPPAQRRVEDIPRGLAALIKKSWERIAFDAVVVDGLGILCAAREALTLDELGAVAGWNGEAQRRIFVRAARELLVETLRQDGQPEYRLHHDAIRGHIAQAIGDVALRGQHGALARRHATWPAPEPAVARRYALRHALIHRAEAGDWADAWQLAADMSFLEAKYRELGVHETETDVTRMAERCRASDDAVVSQRFGDLARALGRESHWLRAAPEAIAALVWNRLRRSGWSATDLDRQLRVPVDAGFLRVRHAVTRESPALVRDLVGHSGSVTACAVTPDGRRVVSASGDQTLKVWDVETHACLLTHRGDASYSAVAAGAIAIVAGDSTGGLWFLDWPPSTRRAQPHRASSSADSHGRSHPAHAPPSPRPLMKKHTILFLAANPLGTDHRDQFELVTRWAAQPLDLLRELRKLKPTVVHFSGHGGHGTRGEPRPGEAPRRDVIGDPGALDGEHQRGLFFQGPDGRPQLVSTAALEATFGAAGSSVKLVVLNACYSDVQAEALLAHIDCVVGMGGSILDDAARSFAIGFYGGLGERESVAAAYQQGRAAITLEGLHDSDRPRLKVRDGVDASQLVLAADPS